MTSNFVWSVAPVRIAESMLISNHFFDRLAEVAAKPAGPERQQALDALNAEFNFHREIGVWTIIMHPDWPVTMLGERQKLFDRSDVAQTHRNLALVAMGAGDLPQGRTCELSGNARCTDGRGFCPARRSLWRKAARLSPQGRQLPAL